MSDHSRLASSTRQHGIFYFLKKQCHCQCLSFPQEIPLELFLSVLYALCITTKLPLACKEKEGQCSGLLDGVLPRRVRRFVPTTDVLCVEIGVGGEGEVEIIWSLQADDSSGGAGNNDGIPDDAGVRTLAACLGFIVGAARWTASRHACQPPNLIPLSTASLFVSVCNNTHSLCAQQTV